MTTEKNIKTLEMLKIEKMFIGVIDKGYHRRLFDTNSYIIQFNYYNREHNELKNEVFKLITEKYKDKKNTLINIRNEIADCINTLEILYEIILKMEIKEG